MAIEEDQVRSSDIYKTLSAPLDVQVEVTTLCNEACVHCYNFWRGKQFKKEVANFPQKTLQKDQLSHIMAGLIQDQVFSVTFTGGEPFLYRSTVIEGIRQAREGGLDCSLNSNLTTMTPATADRLRKMGLGSILTSLHSFDEEIHDAITQREGFFKRTVRGIKICQEAGLSVAANMVVTRMNQNQVFETGAFVKKLGVKSFSATKATPCLGGTNFSEIGINRGAFKQMLEDLLRLEKDEGIDVDVLMSYPLCALGDGNHFRKFAGDRKGMDPLATDSLDARCSPVAELYHAPSDFWEKQLIVTPNLRLRRENFGGIIAPQGRQPVFIDNTAYEIIDKLKNASSQFSVKGIERDFKLSQTSSDFFFALFRKEFFGEVQ